MNDTSKSAIKPIYKALTVFTLYLLILYILRKFILYLSKKYFGLENPYALAWIFGIALIIRFVYTLVIYMSMGPDGLLYEDSSLYIALAQDFIESGNFQREISDGGYVNETERMPLYIIYLAIHQIIIGSTDPLFPSLTQGVLGSITCIVIAKMAGIINRRYFLIAGLFAACNPTMVIIGTNILTEGIFFFLTTYSLYFSMMWLKKPSWKIVAYLGFILALAVSTRVMALPWVAICLFILPIGSILLSNFKLSQIGQMILILFIVLALQTPILVRNISQYDTWSLTSQTGTHSLNWLVPLVLEVSDGTPQAEGAKIMKEKYAALYGDKNLNNPFEKSDNMQAVAIDELTKINTGTIIKAWILGAGINLFSPSLILSPPVKQIPRTGFYETSGDSKIEKVKNFLLKNDSPIYAWVLIISLICLLLTRLLQLGGMAHILINRSYFRDKNIFYINKIIFIFLLIWVSYIIFINGPIASPKYRLPIEPIAAITFSAAFYSIYDWFQKKKKL